MQYVLSVGDRVLVRNLRFRTKHKLADRWEPDIYIVTKQMGSLPVYTLKPEKADGPLRTLHRDLLLPCGFLSGTPEEPEGRSKPSRPRTRQMQVQEEDDGHVQEDDDNHYCQLRPSSQMEEKHFEIYEVPRSSPPKQMGRTGQTERDSCMSPNGLEAVDRPHNLPVEDYLSEEQEQVLYMPSTSRSNEPGNDDGSSPPESGAESQPPLTEMSSVDELQGQTEAIDNHGSDLEVERSCGDQPLSELGPPPMDMVHQSSPMEPSQKASEGEEGKQIIDAVPAGGSDTSQPLRRSERHHQPSRRLDYPQLGHPMITAVKSLFQGLGTALMESLGDDGGDYWLQSQSFDITTPIVG